MRQLSFSNYCIRSTAAVVFSFLIEFCGTFFGKSKRLNNKIKPLLFLFLIIFTFSDLSAQTTLFSENMGGIVPEFDEPLSWVQNSDIPDLPTTSKNGITGTWSPAINNMATTTYAFTPEVGQNAIETTLTISVFPTSYMDNQQQASSAFNQTCSVNGVNVTCTSATSLGYIAPNPATNSFCNPPTIHTPQAFSTTSDIVFDFSVPITSVRIPFYVIDHFNAYYSYQDDAMKMLVNNTGVTSYTNICGFTYNSTYDFFTCNLPNLPVGAINSGNGGVTISSTIPFTKVTIEDHGWSSFSSHPCDLTNIVICHAGANVPNLSTSNIVSICPNSGTNLNSITASNLPSNTTLNWFTTSQPSSSSLVANPSSAPSGTYYAAFYDAVNNCYSPTSVAVTATATQCISDLEMKKTMNNTQPSVGQNVTFTLTAHNAGPNTASGVVVTDVLPSGYTFVSATPSTGTWTGSNWTIGNFVNGATATLSLIATVIAPTTLNTTGIYTNIASITGNQNDPDPRDNTDEITPSVIYAALDDFSSTIINSCNGGSTVSVLTNDSLNGYSITSSSQIITSIVNDGGLTGTTIDSNGIITVPPGLYSYGIYTVRYRICQQYPQFGTNCSENIVKIKIANTIDAVNDDFSTLPINTLTGGVTPTVFTNDILNGATVSNGAITASIVSVTPSITPSPTIDSNGVITIPIGTTIGTYTIKYKIIENGCSANFDTANVTVVVSEQIITTPNIALGIRANNIVWKVDTQSDGKIIIAGAFTTYNNIPCNNIARLNTDLTLDPTFNTTGPSIYGSIRDMIVIKNTGENYNKILVMGLFTDFSGGSNGVGIARLNTDGSIDTTFNSNYTGPSQKGVSGSNNTIYCCYVYPDGTPNAGKILIGGQFRSYNGIPRNKIARLMPNGDIDLSFNADIYNNNPNSSPGFNSAPAKIVALSGPNSKIIVGGYFTILNDNIVNGIVKLNDDGTRDFSFNTYSGTDTGFTTDFTGTLPYFFGVHVEDIVVQSDGKIIVGGLFRLYNGVSRNNIVRLSSSGTPEPNSSFNVGTGFNNTVANTSPYAGTYGLVRDLDLDATGKLYVAGDFTAYQGFSCQEMIRINTSGASSGLQDINGFKLADDGTNGTIYCMKRQGDGKIIIGGAFTTYSTFSALNVTRIFPSPSSGQAKNGTVYYESEPEAAILATNDIIIYPNPSNGKINLKTDGFENQKTAIALYTVLGQKVFEKKDIEVNSTELDLSFLNKGTYFITFTTPETTITKSLIIK